MHCQDCIHNLRGDAFISSRGFSILFPPSLRSWRPRGENPSMFPRWSVSPLTTEAYRKDVKRAKKQLTKAIAWANPNSHQPMHRMSVQPYPQHLALTKHRALSIVKW